MAYKDTFSTKDNKTKYAVLSKLSYYNNVQADEYIIYNNTLYEKDKIIHKLNMIGVAPTVVNSALLIFNDTLKCEWVGISKLKDLNQRANEKYKT